MTTLTQQQGGEQEARVLLARECGFDPDSCGKFEGAVVSEAGALRAITAALLAKSDAYDALVARIDAAPAGMATDWGIQLDNPDAKPEPFTRCRLLVSDDRPSHTAGEK